jgi:hypothetical protein
MGTKASELELSGAHRQWRPWGLLVLVHGLPGAMTSATGMGKPSFQAPGVLGPAFQAWAPV